MAISQVSASASTTLDQGTDTVINSMTLTPGAGTYLAIFSCTVISNAAPVDADTLTISIYSNGSQVSNTERYYIEDNSFTSTQHMIAVAATMTVADSQAIDIRYRVSATGRPFTSTFRTLTLLPVSSGNITQITDGVDDTLASSTYTVVDNMTNTPASGDYLVLFSSTIQLDTDDDLAAFAFHLGGTIQQHTERTAYREQSYNQFGVPIFLAAVISANGSQAIDVRWQRQTGAGTMTCNNRMMILIKLSSGDWMQSTATTDDSNTNTSPPAIVTSMVATTPASDDWVAIFGSSDWQSLGGTLFSYQLFVGGSLDSASQRENFHEGSLDAADVPIALHGRVSPNGSQNVDTRWWGDDTASRTVRERTLILVREASGVTTQTKTVNITAVLQKTFTKTVNISAVLRKTVISNITIDAVITATAIDLEGYRWREDDGSEITASWFKPQDHVHSGAVSTNMRLRVIVNTTGGVPANAWQLEYRRQGTDPWFRVLKDE